MENGKSCNQFNKSIVTMKSILLISNVNSINNSHININIKKSWETLQIPNDAKSKTVCCLTSI